MKIKSTLFNNLQELVSCPYPSQHVQQPVSGYSLHRSQHYHLLRELQHLQCSFAGLQSVARCEDKNIKTKTNWWGKHCQLKTVKIFLLLTPLKLLLRADCMATLSCCTMGSLDVIRARPAHTLRAMAWAEFLIRISSESRAKSWKN